MNCIVCGKVHEKKGKYCSKKCTDKAYRDRKKETEQAQARVAGVEIVNLPWAKSTWCNFCGTPLSPDPANPHFCSEEHHIEYSITVHEQGVLKIRLDQRTIIETSKYLKIQSLIESMFSRNKFLVSIG